MAPTKALALLSWYTSANLFQRVGWSEDSAHVGAIGLALEPLAWKVEGLDVAFDP